MCWSVGAERGAGGLLGPHRAYPDEARSPPCSCRLRCPRLPRPRLTPLGQLPPSACSRPPPRLLPSPPRRRLPAAAFPPLLPFLPSLLLLPPPRRRRPPPLLLLLPPPVTLPPAAAATLPVPAPAAPGARPVGGLRRPLVGSASTNQLWMVSRGIYGRPWVSRNPNLFLIYNGESFRVECSSRARFAS